MENKPSTKVCPRCGREKPLSEFGHYAGNADGRSTYCRECNRSFYRERHGGTAHLLSKFTDAELLAELQRRNLIAQKHNELGALVAPEYSEDDSLSSEDKNE